jgi:DNA-3-methyladenine glycosylase
LQLKILALIPKSFYQRPDVVLIAKELLGKYVFTCFEGKLTGGIITETEAYAGVTDKASHAFGGRRTDRTEIMFREGGTAYVYLCYGVHSLFNIVTHQQDIPHAILIRGIYPTAGLDIMLSRTGKAAVNKDFCAGPGKVSKALGIHYSHSGLDLYSDQIWLEDKNIIVKADEIYSGKRIGVDYAGEDSLLPYRFIYTKYQKIK